MGRHAGGTIENMVCFALTMAPLGASIRKRSKNASPMSHPFRYDRSGPGDADAHDHDSLLRQAFSTPPERNAAYRKTFGAENLRFVRIDGEMAATLTVIPMGQYYEIGRAHV